MKNALIIRNAEIRDLWAVAQQISQFIGRTAWNQYPELRVDPISWWNALCDNLRDPGQIILVAEQNGKIVGAIGGSMFDNTNPPFLPYAKEWAWVGKDKRITTQLWKVFKHWAAEHGAAFAGRVKQLDGRQPRELLTWEALWHSVHQDQVHVQDKNQDSPEVYEMLPVISS